MDAGAVDILSRHAVRRRRLTVAEYVRMGEAGILGENDRVELIEGQLIAMSPIGVRHALAVDALTEQLVMAVAGRAKVRVQNPVTLGNHTEPQPDIALVRRDWRGHLGRHPGPDDIFLVVEVADSTVPFDSGVKRQLYGSAGIAEYWIVDLTADTVRVHRGPTHDGYAAQHDVIAPARLGVQALPGVTIEAGPLFA